MAVDPPLRVYDVRYGIADAAHGVAEILEDFTALEEMLAELNPGLRWLLTVSPVPLAAKPASPSRGSGKSPPSTFFHEAPASSVIATRKAPSTGSL